MTLILISAIKFQLTRLMRGVTNTGTVFATPTIFQLTRLMRGVTSDYLNIPKRTIISTHTPHARRDLRMHQFDGICTDFNSHASCEA